jgi:polyhydroxyalkanoate synthesis regulator protein
MGDYLEKSMQLFMDQQAQFRQQMGGMLGQTPWAMMNQLTERNMELWKEFQQNLVGGMGRSAGGGASGTGTGGAGPAAGGKTPRGS